MKKIIRNITALITFVVFIFSLIAILISLLSYLYKEKDNIKRQFKKIKLKVQEVQSKTEIKSEPKPEIKPFKEPKMDRVESVKFSPVKPLDHKVYLDKTKNLILNSRQAKLLNYVKENKKITMSELNSKFKTVTQRTLRRDLDKLENEGILTQQGNTRNSVYILK